MNHFHSHRLRKSRYSETGRMYMITTACDQRRRIFENACSARIVMREFVARSVEGGCVNLAYVVMPDHVHWMIQLTAQGELSEIVARTKGRSARRINRSNSEFGRIWQPGFYDHAIRKEEDIENLANYLIHNPVRAGLVPEPERYPYWWSMWHAHVGPEGPPTGPLRA